MDNPNHKAGGGRKKKKRGERQKKLKGQNGAESNVGVMPSGDRASDLGEKSESVSIHALSALGFSDTNEGLGSQGREGAEPVMVEQSDVENDSLVTDGISKDAEAPLKSNDANSYSSSSDEEEGYKDCEVPVKGELENVVALHCSSSSLTDNGDSPSVDGGRNGIDDVQDFEPKQVALGNSSNSDLAKDAESMASTYGILHEQADRMSSPKGSNVETAASETSPEHDSEQLNSKLYEDTSQDSGANIEEKIDAADELPSETQVNQVSGLPDLDLQQNQNEELHEARQVSGDRTSLFYSVSNLPTSLEGTVHSYKDERDRNMSIDESFVDALDRLTEGRSASLDESAFVMDGGLLDKERLVYELQAYKDALEQAKEENMQLVSKLNSYQMQVEKLCLAGTVQDSATAEADHRTKLEASISDNETVLKTGQIDGREEVDKTNMLLVEQEHLKQVLQGWEQEKSEMTKALEDLRIQLQVETEQRTSLSHELEVTQQKLHELGEERDALESNLKAKLIDMEDMKKQRNLVEEKLQISQAEGENLAMSMNKFKLDCSTLQQKVQDLEAEKEGALSRMMGVLRNVEVELMNEAQEVNHCLEDEVERFTKEAKDREDEHVQMIEKLRDQLQTVSDENHNLLTQFDEHAKNMMKVEQENQLVKNELTELKLSLDEANKAKELIARDYESYKLETFSAIAEKEGLEAESMRSRQRIDEVNFQISHLKDELHEAEDEKLKLMGDLDKYKLLAEKLERERADLSKDLDLVRVELEQIKREAEFHKTLEEGRNQLVEENNKLSAELHDCNKLLSGMREKQFEHDNQLRGLVLELCTAAHESVQLTSKLHKRTSFSTEVKGECLKPTQENDSSLFQNQTEFLNGDSIDQGTSLGADPNDHHFTTHHTVEKLEETIQRHNSTSELDILNIESQLSIAVNAISHILAEYKVFQEERVSAVKELSSTCYELKNLVFQKQSINEDGEELLNHLECADAQAPMTLNILVDDCGKLVKQLQETLGESSQLKATISELESALFKKDQDIQDINAQYVKLSQECGQFEEINARCTALDEKCADMAYYTSEIVNERDSLRLEVDALQKSVLEKEILMKASADSHDDLKCQIDKAINKLIGTLEEVIQGDMLVTDPCMQRISYLETSLLLLIEKYKTSLSQVNLVQTSLFELASSYGHLWEKEPTMPLDVILKEVFSCKEKELVELNEKLDETNSIRNQKEVEVMEVRDMLCKFEQDLREIKNENDKLRSDLDQTETKLASVREKLSLAVSKGKGLVQQRDMLRQSLTEKSNELEKCLHELQMKTDALHEAEMKAAEHVKTLESELTAVQNAASFFEESLLQKDLIFQKIESLLKEVNWPEELHSKKTIDKIEWLCKALSQAQHDVAHFQHRIENVQRVVDSSATEQEESKTRITNLEESLQKEKQEKEVFVKSIEELSSALSQAQEDVAHFQHEIENVQKVCHLSAIELADSKTKVDNLEESLLKEKQEKETSLKFLEELTRSLCQAQQDVSHFKNEYENVQRVADFSAIELEGSKERMSNLEENLLKEKQEKEALVKNVEELSRALSQSQQDVDHFQHVIEKNQRVAYSSTIELQETMTKINNLEESLLKEKQEKEALMKDLEELSRKYQSLEAAQDAAEKESSCNKPVDQQVEVRGRESSIEYNLVDKSSAAEDCMRKILGIVNETVKDQDFEESTSYSTNGEHLEGCLRKLIDKLNALSEEVRRLKETENSKTEELQGLQVLLDTTNMTLVEINKKHQEAYSEVASLKAEINSLMEQNTIMSKELLMIKDQKDVLKVQLEETEERSSIIREKLSMAVKKGKGLVQQRDSLKQSIDEKEAELGHLRTELQVRESAIKELSSELEHFKSLEADINFSRNRCAELEKLLLDSNSMMQRLMNSVDSFDFPNEVLSLDPIEKIEWLGKSVHQQQQKISFAEEAATKFKEEADTLATKFDEACKNICSLEDEVRDSENKIAKITNEKRTVESESNHEIQVLKDLLAARTEQLSEAHARADCHISELVKQHASLNNLRKEHECMFSLLENDFPKKLNLLRSMELSFKNILSQLDASKKSKLLDVAVSSDQTYSTMKLDEEVNYLSKDAVQERYREEHVDHLLHDYDLHKGQIVNELLSYLEQALDRCTGQVELLKERFGLYCNAVDQGVRVLSQLLNCTREDVITLVESMEFSKQNLASLEALNNSKDNEILMLRDNVTALVTACKNAMEEVRNLKVQIILDGLSSSEELMTPSENSLVMQLSGQEDFTSTGKCMMTAANLLFTIRDFANAANEKSEQNKKEVGTLKYQSQQAESKEAEKSRICSELEHKLMKVEAVIDDIARERDVNKAKISELENHIASLEKDGHALESSMKELQTHEASMNMMREELASLHGALVTKNQAFEDLCKKLQELENVCHQKQEALDNLESSHGKALAELSDYVSKHDELRQLSEGLMAEVDDLHLQLESRDKEISRLKEEAAEVAYDIPSLLENIEKKDFEIGELQTGLENIITKLGVDHVPLEKKEESRVQMMLCTLQERISAIMSESESSRADAQDKDILLHNAENTVEELSGKLKMLESFLHEKQTQFEVFRLEKHPQPVATAEEGSEIEELGQSSNTPLSTVPIAPHVRSTRKASSNHLALTIDTESDKLISDSEDHDKGHAFKAMTSTGLIPKSTQSVADWIDGIWVAGGRMLMRQPTARMGLIVYWVVIHLWMVATLL